MKSRLRSFVLLSLLAAAPAIAEEPPPATPPAPAPEATAAPAEKDDNPYEKIAILARAMQIIRQDYVNERKVSYEQLTRAAMRGMMQSLDPHSQYMEPASLVDMKEDTESRFGGLGVHLTVRDGDLVIVSPMEDSPGFKAGLMPGDQIIKIDGQSTEKMDLNDAVNQLRGAAGTKITLTILRPGTKEIKEFEMVREEIKVWSVKDAKFLPAESTGGTKIGYARITQFNAPTADELAKKLEELEKQGMQAFILDLRFNPGGLLNSAVDIAGMFLPPATVVATTEGRVPSQNRKYTANPSLRRRADYPMAVLINNGSASASEIVSGALKDTNRAILVGERTFGKGSVQSILQLPDNSALRLTTAKYYTPSHQVIHEHGVEPTIRVPMSQEQEHQLIIQRREDLSEEVRKKELGNFRDIQLDRAVDALRGVLIYAQKSDGKK